MGHHISNSHSNARVSEKHYQTIFYLMFSFLNIYIRTEVKSRIGRAV